MIDNDYILELNLEFNLIKMIRFATKSKSKKDLLPHQRLVEDFDYLAQIQKKIPILGTIWNVYNFKSNYLLDTHIDSHRTATLNIPLLGGEDSVTKFYKNQNVESTYIKNQNINLITDKLEETFRFTLVRPTVIKTDVPHSIKVGKSDRLSISWGLVCSFDEAKNYFKYQSDKIYLE
jgi:hypothetical protein